MAKMVYIKVETGHYKTLDGRVELTKDYIDMWSIRIDGRLLPQMPPTLAEAKAAAERAIA